MILILSTDDMEQSTDSIIDWLEYYNVNYKRINGEILNSKQEYSFRISNGINNEVRNSNSIFSLNPEDVSVIWFRRWNQLSHLSFVNKIKSAKTAIDIYKQFFFSEIKTLHLIKMLFVFGERVFYKPVHCNSHINHFT
jgi:hypothetical protein